VEGIVEAAVERALVQAVILVAEEGILVAEGMLAEGTVAAAEEGTVAAPTSGSSSSTRTRKHQIVAFPDATDPVTRAMASCTASVAELMRKKLKRLA
jgi:hypothetical protein